MKEYLTITEINKLSDIFPCNRTIQRKANDKLTMYPDKYEGLIKIENNKYLIHYSILSEFEPVYKKTIDNPVDNHINVHEWDVFGDFVPYDSTPTNVLTAIMRELFKYLKENTNNGLKMYYVIEEQSKADKHIHYYIQSSEPLWYLTRLIQGRIEILSLCDQYQVSFKNEIKPYATEYLNKGKKNNYKRATFVHSELLSVGTRINNKSQN